MLGARVRTRGTFSDEAVGIIASVELGSFWHWKFKCSQGKDCQRWLAKYPDFERKPVVTLCLEKPCKWTNPEGILDLDQNTYDELKQQVVGTDKSIYDVIPETQLMSYPYDEIVWE